MAQSDLIEMEGVVEDASNGIFKVKTDTGSVVNAHLGGKMRKHRIRVVVGDQVKVEVSPYDLSKGRIQFRIR